MYFYCNLLPDPSNKYTFINGIKSQNMNWINKLFKNYFLEHLFVCILQWHQVKILKKIFI